MKRVTITLDERIAAWVRVHAAEHNTSVSRIVERMLQRRMRAHREYDEAMRHFLARKPVKLKRPGHRYASRDELNGKMR